MVIILVEEEGKRSWFCSHDSFFCETTGPLRSGFASKINVSSTKHLEAFMLEWWEAGVVVDPSLPLLEWPGSLAQPHTGTLYLTVVVHDV